MWQDDYNGKLAAVKRVADEFADLYIPLDELIACEAKKHSDPFYLAEDGVHPSNAGHRFIANAFLDALI